MLSVLFLFFCDCLILGLVFIHLVETPPPQILNKYLKENKQTNKQIILRKTYEEAENGKFVEW